MRGRGKMTMSARHAWTTTTASGLRAGQVASAVLLLAMALIHLYLVAFAGFGGGLLGVLFVLNGIGGIVLAVAMLGTRRTLLALASVASLLFLGGTLTALLLALSPIGVLGIHESITTTLVPTTLVVEAVGVVVLAVTSALAVRARAHMTAG